jgi:hypothetical protein
VAINEQLAFCRVGGVKARLAPQGHEVQPHGLTLHKLQARKVAVHVPANKGQMRLQYKLNRTGAGTSLVGDQHQLLHIKAAFIFNVQHKSPSHLHCQVGQVRLSVIDAHCMPITALRVH